MHLSAKVAKICVFMCVYINTFFFPMASHQHSVPLIDFNSILATSFTLAGYEGTPSLAIHVPDFLCFEGSSGYEGVYDLKSLAVI